jgi:hypothetical protein
MYVCVCVCVRVCVRACVYIYIYIYISDEEIYEFYLFLVFSFNTIVTDRHGRMINISTWYSGGPGFKSRPGYRLTWLRFIVVFFTPSKQVQR